MFFCKIDGLVGLIIPTSIQRSAFYCFTSHFKVKNTNKMRRVWKRWEAKEAAEKQDSVR